jgi:hypothetical protein
MTRPVMAELSLLAEVVDDPMLAPLLTGGAAYVREVMLAVGRAADGMIVSSRRRLLEHLRAGDSEGAALERHVVRDSGRWPGLDPGGGEFGPDGRYYVTMRRRRTIGALPAALNQKAEFLLPEGIVPFPRGFGFGDNGRLYLSSGVAPCGEGDNTIVVSDRSGTLRTPRLVTDPS